MLAVTFFPPFLSLRGVVVSFGRARDELNFVILPYSHTHARMYTYVRGRLCLRTRYVRSWVIVMQRTLADFSQIISAALSASDEKKNRSSVVFAWSG